MKTKLAAILAVVIMLAACGGGNTAQAPENERHFYYQNTRWGMTLEEVEELRGKPDIRTDEIEYEPEQEGYSVQFDAGEQTPEYHPGGESADADNIPEYIDFYYDEKPIFDKYQATEQFLFDEEQKLWGVIDLVDVGEVSKDLTNRDEVKARAEETYMDLRDILTEQFGPPAAEYTAYQEAGEYKTDELLDLEKENAIICASRWDGDDYRFIYIIYFMNNLSLDVRYIPHDKETVDGAAAAG